MEEASVMPLPPIRSVSSWTCIQYTLRFDITQGLIKSSVQNTGEAGIPLIYQWDPLKASKAKFERGLKFCHKNNNKKKNMSLMVT